MPSRLATAWRCDSASDSVAKLPAVTIDQCVGSADGVANTCDPFPATTSGAIERVRSAVTAWAAMRGRTSAHSNSPTARL